MSKESKEYKPILVLYIDEPLSKDQVNYISKMSGYTALVIQVDDNPRAEIISADKATVVEDVQKYINENK